MSDRRNRILGLAEDRPYFEGFDPSSVPSPCFVVDRAAVQYNLNILAEIAAASGAKILAALKAFSMFAVFDQIRSSLSGACASGIFEARLAREEMNAEVHCFAPAYKESELRELLQTADHIVFNSLAQWVRFREVCLAQKEAQAEERKKAERAQLSFGLRINPEHSEGTVPLYDPCAPLSRLGQTRASFEADRDACRESGLADPLAGLEGIHFHTLCEQGAEPLERTLDAVDRGWGDVLLRPEIRWLNMGGGHHITKPDYNRALLVELLRKASAKYQVQVYLEPGEAVAIHSGILRASVVDIHLNQRPIAILDTSATCHMPDTLEMPYVASVWGASTLTAWENHQENPKNLYRLGGQTCLAGDVMGDYAFERPLAVGDAVIFDDMSHYTMVKTSTFNGVPLPALALFDSRTGETRMVKRFGYEDFRSRLS